MNGREMALLFVGLLFLVIAVGLMIGTADMEPCWPNCSEVGK